MYRFGLQDALGTGVTLRTSLTFTPALSLQLYAQLFFADVQYRALYEAQAQGTPRCLGRVPVVNAFLVKASYYFAR